jgi:F-type H+-transporting ATPase subunit epsilon
MKLFDLKILNPQKKIYSDKVVSVVLPTDTGSVGILADHMSLVANVIDGEIIITKESGQKETLKSFQGILSVFNNQVTILLLQ